MTDSQHIPEEELSAILDGEGHAERRTQIDLHLKDCAHCRETLSALGALRTRLGRWPQEELPPELWGRISRGLPPQSKGFWAWCRRRWYVPLTTLSTATAVASLLWVFLAPPRTTKLTGGDLKALTAVVQAEGEYRQALESLQAGLDPEASGWSLATRTSVKQNLDEIDRLIEKTRLSVRAEPTDLHLQKSLLAAYQKKVDFLMDLSAAAY